VARRSLLQLADLPADWTASEQDNRSEPKCSAVKRVRRAASARSSSAGFSHRPTGEVAHYVYVFADDQQAEAAYGALVARDTRQCIGSQLRERFANLAATRNVSVGNVETSVLVIDPVGQQSSAARITIGYATSSEPNITLNVDVLFVRDGRGISALLLTDETDSFYEALRARLASIADRRLRNALDHP
jgi:hypothetical protein